MTPEELDAERLYSQARELTESGQAGAAIKSYEMLCSKFPADPRFHIAFAVLLQSLGHWEQSIEKFLKGLELRPHYCEGDARLMLAESYIRSGQRTKALEQWRIVAEMAPEYPSYDAVPNEAKRRLREPMGPFTGGWDESDVERVLERGDPEERLYVPVVVGMNAPDVDRKWAQDVCVRLIDHPHFQVRGNAYTGLGHIARTCRELDLDRMVPLIAAGLNAISKP